MIGTTSLLTVWLLVNGVPQTGDYFQIRVQDEQTGRGVPLVELRTVNNIRYYTDSAGVVAFYEPGLMNRTVFFHVDSHGYEFGKDGFGFRGKRLKVSPGGKAVLKLKRINVAERLYRVTGAGIYRDSLLLGDPVPIAHPALNAQVFGSDSVVNAVYRGKVYWFWGDTNRPSYPLGNFHVPGATSLLPQDGGLDPERGVNLDYFVNEDGFAKETAPMPGQGPTWISGLVVLKDASGRERLFAEYVKVRGFLEVYHRGLCVFNDEKQEFEHVTDFDMQAPLYPGGHPFLHVEDGTDYVYFANPYPLIRVPATSKALQDLAQYETFTCLKQRATADSPVVDRDEQGRPVYAWKHNTPPLTTKLQQQLIDSHRLKPEEGLRKLRDVESGQPVRAHGGSVYWNEYRKRWVMIALEARGTSPLGEIWYAEADDPVGPWVYARKIVTHEKYSFYNPKQHPMFDREGGRIIFFEGTYTNTFSGNSDATPRYNYNQILYKLDLSDDRVKLPVAVYRVRDSNSTDRYVTRSRMPTEGQPTAIAFFALDRPVPGAVPVFESRDAEGHSTLRAGSIVESDEGVPLFYALASDADDPPATTRPLYEFVHRESGRRLYATAQDAPAAGYQATGRIVCRVWENPLRVRFPP